MSAFDPLRTIARRRSNGHMMRSNCLALAASLIGAAPATVEASIQAKGAGRPMAERLTTGHFEVNLKPLAAADDPVGAMLIDKRFFGGLEGKSLGQMLAVRTAIPGSAGYVAMERVTGTLEGRQGSFALQHSGTMNNGAQSLSVTVVPDSGTDGLTRLTGTMEIIIESGKHNYRFRYALPD